MATPPPETGSSDGSILVLLAPGSAEDREVEGQRILRICENGHRQGAYTLKQA